MSFLASIAPALIVLGILIIIHEFGHFIACRLTGVKVEKFSIGFGPEILHWNSGGTSYVLSLLPLGGFVKPAGETVSETGDDGMKPGDYLAASLPARIFIVCAGVMMNYLLAFFLFVAIFMMGRPVPGTTIGGFVDGYPAATSGLVPGDRVVQVGSTSVETWTELTGAIESAPAGQISLVVDRAGSMVPIQLTPLEEQAKDIFGKEVSLRRLGITPDPAAGKFERYGLGQSVTAAWDTTSFLTVMTHKAIFYLFMGKLSIKAMSGPIGIINMAGSAAQLGLPYILQLMATLSISLAVINLLPIPALDGGHLLFLLIEAVRRRRVSLQVQERFTQIGFAVLLAFMAFVIYNDLINLDVFGKIKTLFQRL